MKEFPFDTHQVLSGPYRYPRQMLEAQNYDGHGSIHDNAVAGKLGFSGAPIEGPTHFSQFEPLLVRVWGRGFYEQGCISAHYKNMVVEGEAVKASVEFPSLPDADIGQVRIFAEKEDHTRVLEGTASMGSEHLESELDRRMSTLRKPEKLIILRDMQVGDKGAKEEMVRMGFNQNLGALYPFTLAEKLEKITERCPWYQQNLGKASPWGRPIIPFEMISVLVEHTVKNAGWKMRSPRIGLFADLEIRMIDGPLFVDETYLLEREIIALSESPRTESYWVRTLICNAKTGNLVASSLLNHAVVKLSFPGYEEERSA
jgi:hypothetical protein